METIEEGVVGPAGGVVGFDRRVAASDGLLYNVNEAEQRDLKHMVENSCMYCSRLLAKEEIRVVPPEYVQERDPYVLEGFVRRRVLCVECYNKMTSSAREKVKTRYKNMRNNIRERLLRSVFAEELTQK